MKKYIIPIFWVIISSLIITNIVLNYLPQFIHFSIYFSVATIFSLIVLFTLNKWLKWEMSNTQANAMLTFVTILTTSFLFIANIVNYAHGNVIAINSITVGILVISVLVITLNGQWTD